MKRVSTVLTTTLDDVIREAHRLSKPSLVLTEKLDGPMVGMWRGDPRADSPPGYEHLLSVDCEWLRRNGFRMPRSLSLHLQSRRRSQSCLLLPHDEPLDAVVENGEKLFGQEMDSFPPIHALERFASPSIVQTINDVKNSRSLRNAYINWWSERSPQYDRKIAAVLGGWHERWPEDYDAGIYGRPERSLAVWTLWEAEPWIEVCVSEQGEVDLLVRRNPED